MTAKDKPPHPDDHAIGNAFVVALGDHETGEQIEMLIQRATQHGVAISDIHTFGPGAAIAQNDLTEVRAVVTAVSQAISSRADVWVPFPSDLGRDEHLRRLGLVLQRRGVNLRVGPHLWPCPTEGGLNEVDYALRREVQAVDELDNAALAAAATETLSDEITRALAAGCIGSFGSSDLMSDLEAEYGPSPLVPAPTADWRYRRTALKSIAAWMVDRCGLTQAEAARVINELGHRTPQGRQWQQSTISALINGRYDRRAA